MYKTKSIYEPPEGEDGFRIFVDKSWPEGLSKEDAKVDLWLKEIGPTKDVDEWVSGDSVEFDEFKENYRCELRGCKTLIKIIRDIENEKGTVTLLYSIGDSEHNCAVVLRDKLSGYGVIRGSIGRVHGG